MLHVVVGVVYNATGEVLIALRSPDRHLGGLWEFPGGKVEQDETPVEALSRELSEELGIRVRRARPLIKIRHDYSDKSVLLDVWRVYEFGGEAYGREGQPIEWVAHDRLHDYPFPQANQVILKALAAPQRIAITGAFSSSHSFAAKVRQCIQRDAQALYLRLRDVSDPAPLCRIAEAICAASGVNVITNAPHLPYFEGPVGLHLTSEDLLRPAPFSRDAYPSVGASCHTREDIDRAVALGLDYVFLSPVYRTSTHPSSPPMGMDAFAAWSRDVPIPVYALGGMSVDQLNVVRQHHGHGIAAIQAFWD